MLNPAIRRKLMALEVCSRALLVSFLDISFPAHACSFEVCTASDCVGLRLFECVHVCTSVLNVLLVHLNACMCAHTHVIAGTHISLQSLKSIKLLEVLRKREHFSSIHSSNPVVRAFR